VQASSDANSRTLHIYVVTLLEPRCYNHGAAGSVTLPRDSPVMRRLSIAEREVHYAS
jgi:hypothetical protein